MWSLVTSFPLTWLPPPASYIAVGAETYPKREFSTFYSDFLVTSGEITSLPHHFRSRDILSCHMTATAASYSPVGAQTYPKPKFLAFYSHFLVISGQMTSFPGHFRSREVTWRHFLSRDWTSPVSYFLWDFKRIQNANSMPSTATSRWLLVKWSHFRVSFCHVWSHDVIYCCVTATSRKLQPCRSSTYPKTSSGPSTATSCWLPVKLCHFRVTSGHMRSRNVILCHVTAISCKLQSCRSSNVLKTRVLGLLQPLPCDFQSNDITFRTPPLTLITWCHLLLRECHLPQVTTL